MRDNFFVEPGERFYVEYESDGILTSYPVPDLTASTEQVILLINGLLQRPNAHYTVHQGNLQMTSIPIPQGWIVSIRNA